MGWAEWLECDDFVGLESEAADSFRSDGAFRALPLETGGPIRFGVDDKSSRFWLERYFVFGDDPERAVCDFGGDMIGSIAFLEAVRGVILRPNLRSGHCSVQLI